MRGEIKKVKRDLFLIFTIVFIFGLILFFLFWPKGYLAYKREKEEYKMKLRELERVKSERDRLKNKVKKLKEDPDYMLDEIKRRNDVLPEDKNNKYYIIKIKKGDGKK